MKTKTKFILLILVACILSILIYEKIENVKPVTEIEDILVYQEKLEKKFTTS